MNRIDKQGPTVSTENCIQYSVINHNGKECKKYIYNNHFAIQWKLTQHCKSVFFIKEKATEANSHSFYKDGYMVR